MVTDRLSSQAVDDASDEELGAGYGNPVRRSGESASDGARSRRTSITQSQRSSFALERASFEANRSSLEMFGVQAAAQHSAPALPPVRLNLTVCSRCMGQAAALVLAVAPLLAGARGNAVEGSCAGQGRGLQVWRCCASGWTGKSVSSLSTLQIIYLFYSTPIMSDYSVTICQDMLGLGGAVDPEQLCQQLGVPEALRARVLALAVVPPDTPLPMSMLAMLWRLGSLADAEATANLLEGQVRGSVLL